MTTEPNDEFEDAVDNLEAYGLLLQSLIGEVLHASGLIVHSIDYRVKERSSAAKKLARNDEKYSGFADLHDLLGVRVITYFEDEVDKAARALSPEFKIDESQSSDKRAQLDADRFGYMSLHFVAELSSKRAKLIEYQRFSGRCFELQIRSILQHAWAEIEHDLGYKTEDGLPREFRRRFSRLAGMLEIADDEFTRLRRDLQRYETRVKRTIKSKPKSFELNQLTLIEALGSDVLKTLDQTVADKFPSLVADEVDKRYASRSAGELRLLGIRNVETLTSIARSWLPWVEAYAQRWLGNGNRTMRPTPLQRGVGLYYLEMSILNTVEPIRRQKWLEKRRWHVPRGDADRALKDRIDEIWAEVVKELGPPPPLT